MRRSTAVVVAGILFLAQGLFADRPTAPPQSQSSAPGQSAFDPQRHMRVAEVQPGMRGHGLSVFQGTRIDRFEVEVLSVLRNFNPKQDVILIRCSGANLEQTGAISGMSGSPIYLVDDQGRERMVGAFAYGWAMTKDALGGVQPIEYMLALPEHAEGPDLAGSQPPAASGTADEQPRAPGRAEGRIQWSLEDSVPLPGSEQIPPRYPLSGWNVFQPNPQLSGGRADPSRLQPLVTPLMTAGLPAELMQELAPVFEAYGLVPLQAGAGGSAQPDHPPVPLEPGSVMAVPLLTGDIDMTAVGTCTEVIGDRVWGFGHPFMNEGPISLPVGSGYVNAVIPSMMISFKLGSLGQVMGTLSADQSVGVAGRIGEAPETAPIELQVAYADGSYSQTFQFQAALHPRFTPIISSAALAASVRGARELPQHHTIEYDLELEFSNGQVVPVANTAVNASTGDIFFALGTPMLAAADNPFERVLVKRINGNVRVIPEAREAQILSVHVPRLKYRPGETLQAYVTYRPFRAPEAVMPIQVELPRDLPEGEYRLTITDWQRFIVEERTARPFRFTAQSIDEVFDVIREVSSFRRNAVYARLVRQADGVAVGRTAMPQLPSSRRQVMMSAGRSDVTSFVSSEVKIIPTDLVMTGSAQFTLTIDRNVRVDTLQPQEMEIENVEEEAQAAESE
jgi:hypothetical protein